MANKLAEFELLRKELLEHLPYLADDNIFVGYLGLLDNEFNNLINSKYIADGLALSNSILQPYFKTEFPKAKKDVEESEGVEEAEEVEEPSE